MTSNTPFKDDDESPPRRGARRSTATPARSASRNSTASNNNNNNNGSKRKGGEPLKKKKRRGFRGFRRPILTKEDLMEGPVLIPPKEELLAAARSAAQRGKKGRRGRKGKGAPKQPRRPSYSQYLPKDRFDELDRLLGEVDDEPLDVDTMEFSFERRPLNEAWFQTYHRQDQGDEMLFYPDGRGYPLPYEMPMTTFYPSKTGMKKRSQLLGGQDGDSSSFYPSAVPSGTATPEETLPGNRSSSNKRKIPPVPDLAAPANKILRRSAAVKAAAAVTGGGGSSRKDSKASSTDSDCSYVRKKHLARLMSPVTAARVLQPHERKSPRCHASTKALLNAPPMAVTADGDEVEDDDDEEECDVVVDDMEPLMLDESDQLGRQEAPRPSRKREVTENPLHLVRLAGTLDSFLREEDPSLVTDMEEEPDAPRVLLQKRKKRRGSSGRQGSAGSSSKPPIPVEEPMDRLVASNVDPVLLDLLEEECPSVPIDDEVPGSQPLELLSSYENCDSISKCSRRMSRLMEGGGGAEQPRSKRGSTDARESSAEAEKSAPLNRLKSAVAAAAAAAVVRRDSSSEYATSVCSVSSSSSAVRGKRRRKRNLTGFPRIKRKKATRPKSLLNDVLTREASKQNAKDEEDEEEVEDEEDQEEEEEEEEIGSISDSDELDSDDEDVKYKVATPPPRKRPAKKSPPARKSLGRKKGRKGKAGVSYMEPGSDIEESEESEDDDEEEDDADSEESEEDDSDASDEASDDEDEDDEDSDDEEDDDDEDEDGDSEDEEDEDEDEEGESEEEDVPKPPARKLPKRGRPVKPVKPAPPPRKPTKPYALPPPSRVSRRMGRKKAIAAAAARRRR